MIWKALSTTGVILAAALVAPSAQAAAGQVVTKVSEPDRAAALAHWTPERMKAVGDGDLPPAETISQPYEGQAPGVGRLFMSTSTGQDHSCTATVVPSATKDVVLTAGHCVNGGLDRWDNPIKILNVVFVPGYDHGARPHGVFVARAFAWSDTYSGPTSGLDDDAVIALDLAGGSSGGPWLRGFDPATGTIFSVTSRGTMNGDLVTTDLSGAAFSEAVRALYLSANEL